MFRVSKRGRAAMAVAAIRASGIVNPRLIPYRAQRFRARWEIISEIGSTGRRWVSCAMKRSSPLVRAPTSSSISEKTDIAGRLPPAMRPSRNSIAGTYPRARSMSTSESRIVRLFSGMMVRATDPSSPLLADPLGGIPHVLPISPHADEPQRGYGLPRGRSLEHSPFQRLSHCQPLSPRPLQGNPCLGLLVRSRPPPRQSGHRLPVGSLAPDPSRRNQARLTPFGYARDRTPWGLEPVRGAFRGETRWGRGITGEWRGDLPARGGGAPRGGSCRSRCGAGPPRTPRGEGTCRAPAPSSRTPAAPLPGRRRG